MQQIDRIKLLKDFRYIHYFTQKEAGEALGYATNTIANCEQGAQPVSDRLLHAINEYNKYHRKRA